MFVISSIDHTKVSNCIVEEGGMSRIGNKSFSKRNYPVNLRHVELIRQEMSDFDEFKIYQIRFLLSKHSYYWNYSKKEDCDRDYEKLTSLNLIGLFCKLENVE